MKTLQEFLEEQFDQEMMLAVLSGQRKKDADVPSKVRIRPVEIKGTVCYQATATVGQKAIHKNYTHEEVTAYITDCLEDGFSQLQIQGQRKDASVLVSKKGKQTMKVKQHPALEPVKIMAHNRVKQYILKEGIPVPFLVDLGVMNAQGKVHQHSYDKFKQINRFLEFIEDILPKLSKDREVTILDFGCGKSYLTFAMYYYLHQLQQYDVRIVGLDLKEDVIEKCSALAKAVGWGASVILSVPCCQHELNRQIHNEVMAPVFSYGVLKERIAALMTDGLRAQMLEQAGYDTQILEFIDMEHTPKNLLIRAVYTGKKKENDEQLRSCLDAFGLHPTLERLLKEGGREA